MQIVKCILIFNLVIINFANAFKDSTLLIGVNSAEALKTIFLRGVYSIGIQGQYFYKSNNAIFAGFNFMKTTESASLYGATPSNSVYFYTGYNKFIPGKRFDFLSKRVGVILGYYQNVADITFYIPGPFYNGKTYYFEQQYETAFLEGLFGYSFKISDRFSLSPVIVLGINKGFSTSFYEQAPSLGWIHNSMHFRFQAELWYKLR